MARKIEALLEEYGESHQNETNKAVHWICVPVIVWTVMALVYVIPQPGFMAALPWLNWLSLVILGALIYYLVLSPSLAVGVGIYAAICYWLIQVVEGAGLSVLMTAIVLFVVAWIGQFWGHKIEGKKPSFFKDIQFLLIGPAWLLSFLYKRLGVPY